MSCNGTNFIKEGKDASYAILHMYENIIFSCCLLVFNVWRYIYDGVDIVRPGLISKNTVHSKIEMFDEGSRQSVYL